MPEITHAAEPDGYEAWHSSTPSAPELFDSNHLQLMQPGYAGTKATKLSYARSDPQDCCSPNITAGWSCSSPQILVQVGLTPDKLCRAEPDGYEAWQSSTPTAPELASDKCLQLAARSLTPTAPPLHS